MFLPLEYETAVTEDDLGKLLDLIGGIDGQDHGSAADALLWSMAAKAGRWTRAETVAGVLALMREHTGFLIKPGDMQRAVDDARAAVGAGWNPPPPPRELADYPEREREWTQERLVDYRERAIMALAKGEPLASVPMLGPEFERLELGAGPSVDPDTQKADRDRLIAPLLERSVTALAPLTKWEARNATGVRPPVRQPLPSQRNRDAAEKAWAELAETEPGPLPASDAWRTDGAIP